MKPSPSENSFEFLNQVEFSNNGALDSLTGAPAPKVFFDNLAREISKSKRKFQPISIVMVQVLPDFSLIPNKVFAETSNTKNKNVQNKNVQNKNVQNKNENAQNKKDMNSCGSAYEKELISGLFLLVLTLSIGIIDVTDSYLAKRELIAIGEDAILVASHSLDENRYYSGSPNIFGEPNRRVPINCASAALKFSVEISTRNLRRNLIGVSGWSCSDDQITASISSSIQALVNFPILSRINGGKIGVNATIGATSEISAT